MAVTVGQIQAIADIKDNLTPAMGKMEGKLSGFGGKLKSLVGGPLKLLAGGITAGVAAIGTMGAAIVTLGNRGAVVGDVVREFQGFENSKELLEGLRGATAGAVSDMNLMSAANKLLASGLQTSNQDVITLTAGHRLFAKQLGDSAPSIDSIFQAIAQGRTGILKTFGVDTKAAVENYATAIGKTSSELTDADRKQALMNATVEIFNNKIATTGPQAADFGEKIATIKTSVGNAFDRISLAVSESETFNKALDAAVVIVEKASTWFANLAGYIDPVVQGFISLVSNVTSSGGALSNYLPMWQSFGNLIQAVWRFLQPVIKLIGVGLVKAFQVILPVINAVYGGIKFFLDGLISVINTAANLVPGLEAIENPLDGLTAKFAAVTEGTSGFNSEVDATPPALESVQGAVPPTVSALNTLEAKVESVKDKFKRLKIEGIQSFQDLSTEAQEIAQNQMMRNLPLIAGQGGADFSAAFNAGFLQGPGGIGTTIPAGFVNTLAATEGLSLPKFSDFGFKTAGSFSTAFEGFGGSISQTLSRALEGGGGFLGAVQSLGVQAGDRLGSFLSDKFGSAMEGLTGKMGGMLGGVIGSALGIALPIVGPLLGKAAGWISKKLFGIFNKPSEAEKAARQSAEDFVRVSKQELTEGNKLKVGELVSKGWSDSLATIRIMFGQYAEDAGMTNDQAHQHYARYEKAVRDGNKDLMEQLIQDAKGWSAGVKKETDTVEENFDKSSDTIVADAKTIGEQFKGLTATEAKELGDALENLGAKANKGFTAIHGSAMAAGAALANNFLPYAEAIAPAINRAIGPARDLANALSNTSIPGRQHGGPVTAGKPYVVGEKRPELFVPETNGYVHPTTGGGRGGGQPIVIEFHLDGRRMAAHLAKLSPGEVARIVGRV